MERICLRGGWGGDPRSGGGGGSRPILRQFLWRNVLRTYNLLDVSLHLLTPLDNLLNNLPAVFTYTRLQPLDRTVLYYSSQYST
jgi:hypothetical protein